MYGVHPPKKTPKNINMYTLQIVITIKVSQIDFFLIPTFMKHIIIPQYLRQKNLEIQMRCLVPTKKKKCIVNILN